MINQTALDGLLKLEKPSELLTLALDDLDALHRTPGYVIDMDVWIEDKHNGCHVCLAGALLSRRLGMNKEDFENLPYFSPEGELGDTLDYLRTGLIASGVDHFNLATGKNLVVPQVINHLPIFGYRKESHNEWMIAARGLVSKLQRHNL